MTPRSAELAVLMALRVQGRAAADAVAAATGLRDTEVAASLEAAQVRGAVSSDTDSAISTATYRLTAQGCEELAAWLAAEDTDRAALASLYEVFLAIDVVLKAAITHWQLLAGPERDRAVAPLEAAAARASEIADRIGHVAPRFAAYVRRLATARTALTAGDTRFVAGTDVDSLHRVWFEMHEDLLATLGRARQT